MLRSETSGFNIDRAIRFISGVIHPSLPSYARQLGSTLVEKCVKRTIAVIVVI